MHNKQKLINMTELQSTQISEEYWIGPYGCLIHSSQLLCVAADGGNTLFKTGRKTEVCCSIELTEQQWLEEFAIFDENTNYYFYKIGYVPNSHPMIIKSKPINNNQVFGRNLNY
jgi:hypothetical protein